MRRSGVNFGGHARLDRACSRKHSVSHAGRGTPLAVRASVATEVRRCCCTARLFGPPRVMGGDAFALTPPRVRVNSMP